MSSFYGFKEIRNTMRKTLVLIAIGAMFTMACSSSDNDPETPIDSFDRSAMLANWADNIIIPAYQNYVSSLDELKDAKDAFIATSDATTLQVLRTAWLTAYTSWQNVSMFEIGRAEAISLRNFTNIYPADVQRLDENIANGNYNLTLPSTNDEQGFPALDYLLYGLGPDDSAIINSLSEVGAQTYLSDVVERLLSMGTEVLTDWTGDYRDSFVANSGSSATSSVNKLINDFMFYYEKSLRAGKIGIPAGVFSNSPLADRVESYHNGEVSKQLFLEALNAAQNFFVGKHYASNDSGESLQSYLDALSTDKDGERLSALINNQFNASRNSAANISDNLSDQVSNNNTAMLQTYDQLQMNVVLMKVDMFQALSIKVDFVDADGD